MEKVKLVQQRVRFSSLDQIVKLQFIIYCYIKNIHLTPGDYNLLTHIAMYGYDRKGTPEELVKQKKFLHKQSVRNSRNKLLKQGLLVLVDKNRCAIDPALKIESFGPIMIDFKAISS